LHAKLHGGLPNAKREIAFGKLGPEDISNIAKHLRSIMIPVMGLSSVVDIFSRLSQEERNGNGEEHPEPANTKSGSPNVDWSSITISIREPFSKIIWCMDQGLEHALRRLELTKAPKKKKQAYSDDIEATPNIPQPGETGFAKYFEAQITTFRESNKETLQSWCEQKGIDISNDEFERFPTEARQAGYHSLKSQDLILQRQLYILLYVGSSI
jgi:hypothetical protein